MIEPNFDVWYFMLSTTLISLKLLISFFVAGKQKPGYLQKEEGDEFDMIELLKTVPSNKICPFCKVLKTPRSKHCAQCNKCVDRFEQHSIWLNNCVGRHNSNTYFIWIFYVWLDVFLIGWISASSI